MPTARAPVGHAAQLATLGGTSARDASMHRGALMAIERQTTLSGKDHRQTDGSGDHATASAGSALGASAAAPRICRRRPGAACGRDGEGRLVADGAFSAATGPHTGRCPGPLHRRAAGVRGEIDWGKVNQPLDAGAASGCGPRRAPMSAGATSTSRICMPAPTRAPPARPRDHRDRVAQPVRAQHVPRAAGGRAAGLRARLHGPAAARLGADPARTAPARRPRSCSISSAQVLICGTRYAGEIKKSIFTVLNFLLPEQACCRCTARPMSAAMATWRSSSACPAPARPRFRPIPTGS